MSSAINLTSPCIKVTAPSTRSIMDLEPGHNGWTQPWAMWRDHSGKFWLRPTYTLYDGRDMGVNLFVEMMSDGSVVVDATNVHNHLWAVETPGIREACSIPVQTVIRDKNPMYL